MTMNTSTIISPVGSSYGNSQNPQYPINSNSPYNSDGNQYYSPAISPGEWNVKTTSPAYVPVSPHSNSPYQASSQLFGSPQSFSSETRMSPPTSPPSTFSPPALPTNLGSAEKGEDPKHKQQKIQESIHRRFMEKSSMDEQREKIANRRLQSLMLEMSRDRAKVKAAYDAGPKFGKQEAKAFLTSNGTEKFATSDRTKKEPMIMEDLKGSVEDFKCQSDRGREKAAKFHAMRILTKLDNAA